MNHFLTCVNEGNRRAFLVKTFDIPAPIKINEWSLKNPLAFSNSQREFHEFETLKSSEAEYFEEKTPRTHLRTQFFSEQVSKWNLPMESRSNAVSDTKRVGNRFIACTTNPPSLVCVENLLESDRTDVINLRPHLNFWRNFTNAPKLRILCHSDDQVILHNEHNYQQLLVDIRSKTVRTIPSKITETIEKLISSEPWRIVSNKNRAYLYKIGQNVLKSVELRTDGVENCQIDLPFNISRVLASGDTVFIVDENEKLYAVDFDSSTVTPIEQSKTSTPNSFEAIADSHVFTSPDHYYFKCPNITETKECQVFGVVRDPEPLLDLKLPYYLSLKEVIRSIEPSRESVITDQVVAKVVPKWELPKRALQPETPLNQISGALQVIDTSSNQICYVPLPNMNNNSLPEQYKAVLSRTGVHIAKWDESNVAVTSLSGEVTMYEVSRSALHDSFNQWDRMTSQAAENLRLEVEKDGNKVDMSKLDTPKLGKIDPNNTPHHGGNTWMGGTGGYNTAGLGGIGGPFRLDAGHDVHQMPEFAKKQVPDHILKKAREIAEEEYKRKLKEIDMSEYDASAYDNLWENVSAHSKKLSEIIDQLEAKKTERQWEKHQTSGDLDDGKLIDGIVGEKNIYRKRVDKQPDPGTPLSKPKRLRICFDVSGSMYRFNGYDRRLQKSLEAALLFMTALNGKQDLVKYEMYGHSGDGPLIKFVGQDEAPKNRKHELDTLKRMLAHSQYCLSGDNTVECLQESVKELKQSEDFDETVMVLISDANLDRYGIEASTLRKEMSKDPNVNCFVIFIGSLDDQSQRLVQQLPAGKAFRLNDTKELPRVMETIFVSNLFNNV